MSRPIDRNPSRLSVVAYHLGRRIAHRSHHLLFAALLALALLPAGRSAALGAGPARLVKDINTGTLSSSPHSFTVVGNTAFFIANDNEVQTDYNMTLWALSAGTTTPRRLRDGIEDSPLVETNGLVFFFSQNRLWRTDGTLADTFAVSDAFFDIMDLTRGRGMVFFYADNWLWRSDGSNGGTQKVHHIAQIGSAFFFAGGRLFFFESHSNRSADLYSSDGTPAGTSWLHFFPDPQGNSAPGDNTPAQIEPPPDPAPPIVTFFDMNGVLFFTIAGFGTDYKSGLWRSDGTSAGTMLVKDVEDVASLINVGNTLYFTGKSIAGSTGLWKSDGTPAGTGLILKINPNTLGATITGAASVGGVLFFSASVDGHGEELWRSDGTAAGTMMVKDINPTGSTRFFTDLVALNGTLFFGADDGTHGPELWRSDGTAAGTVMVKDISPAPDSTGVRALRSVNGELFFIADDGVHGVEPWLSDGTPGATHMIKDINPGPSSSLSIPPAPELVSLNGKLLFAPGDSAHGIEPWISDGTAAGTLGMDINTVTGDSHPSALTELNGSLFFIASESNDSALWKSSGVGAGANRIDPGSGGLYVYEMISMNGRLYLIASDNTHGRSLWQSDGTPGGTRLVKDISGSNGAYMSGLTNANGMLFFVGYDSVHGEELWRSDGTAAGTFMVKDINPGPAQASIGGITPVNGTLFFVANDSVHGYELWKSDGTPGGTALVKDINPGAPDSDIAGLTNVQGSLFFAADDGTHGVGLWKSDGTPAGTTLVKDIALGTDGSIIDGPWFGVSKGLAFFFADDHVHGMELWKSDGTSAGTVMVKDIRPGSDDSLPSRRFFSFITSTDKALFLVANDGVHGDELWTSDGTLAGTTLVKDIAPDYNDSEIENLTAVNNTVFFIATGDGGRRGLWRSDGTPAGTRLVQDFGPVSSRLPMEAVLAGTSLFFTADDGRTGQELWGIPLSAGVSTAVAASAQASAAKAGVAGISIGYQNTGLLPATTVTLSATLGTGLSYVGDTSGVAPVVSGNTLTWHLRDLGFIDGGDFRLLVRVPNAPLGTRYPITLRLNAEGSTSTTRAEIVVADLHYLPLLAR